jgi:hypothetical protein
MMPSFVDYNPRVLVLPHHYSIAKAGFYVPHVVVEHVSPAEYTIVVVAMAFAVA